MSEPSAGTGPDDVELPAWVTDLVPVADLARSCLVASLRPAGAVVLAVAYITWTSGASAGFAARLLLVFCAAGLALAGLFTGRLGRSPRSASGAGGGGGVESSTDDPAGSVPGAAAQAGPGAPAQSVRPGGRTLAALLALDIVGTGLGLVVLGLAAVCDVEGGLMAAATAAGALIAVGTLGVLADELVPRRGWAWPGCSGLATALVLLGCAAVLSGGWGLWWLVGALVVLADAAGLLALRAGRRRDVCASAA